MEKIKNCTKELIRAILESEEYRQFCDVRDRLEKEPELRRQVSEFRFHVFEVQNSDDITDMYGEQKRLCKESEEFRKNPLVDEFLQAELCVCRIMQKITQDMVKAVDLDIDEVAERIGL